MRFAWDPRKAAANLAMHGVSFEMGRGVFDDPMAIIDVDDRETYAEERWIVIGMAGNRLLFVAYTERSDATIRIISARKATPRETRRYHEAHR